MYRPRWHLWIQKTANTKHSLLLILMKICSKKGGMIFLHSIKCAKPIFLNIHNVFGFFCSWNGAAEVLLSTPGIPWLCSWGLHYSLCQQLKHGSHFRDCVKLTVAGWQLKTWQEEIVTKKTLRGANKQCWDIDVTLKLIFITVSAAEIYFNKRSTGTKIYMQQGFSD